MPTRYFSDLTDVQWDRVRSEVFSAHPTADSLRRVVDGLRFREQAGCPWTLTPADLPPAGELRRWARAWAADGTWGRIRKATQPPVLPTPSIHPPSLRRTIAGALHRLPGGVALLYPTRTLIQLTQYLRNRRTPHARLPGVYREGVEGLAVSDFVTAADRFTRVLALDPANAEARLNRGLARRHQGRLAEARDDFLVALTTPGLSPGLRARANAHLAQIYLLLGDLDRAIGCAFLARLLDRYGADAPWDQDELAEEPDEFELLAEAHNDVGEFAINFASDFATAAVVYARRDDLCRRYERWMASVPARTQYLSADWVRNIGHIALIDFWVKMQHLGWVGASRIVLHAPPRATANRAYTDYFRPFVKVVADPGPGGATRHLAAALGTRVASLLHLPSDDTRYFLEAMGAVQEEWERQGRGPLLRLSSEDEEFGRATLRQMGVPDGAWFVSLHVRSPGFHREGEARYQTHRNADVATYLPAIQEVVRRGGWVVRIGDASMPRLGPLPGVVDYATGPHKTERMDVFLGAACRFFVGVASGFSHLPTTFGAPCLLTNWVSNALPVYSRRDLFIPKLVRSQVGGRVLNFDEWLTPANRARYVLGTEMDKAGLGAIDNTPEELREAVAEMIDQLDGSAAYEAEDDRRLQAFEHLARRHGLVGFARVGRSFLRRHAHLLPGAGEVRKAS